MPSPVVVVIFAHKPQPDPFEEISLRQCAGILKTHPIRLMCPRGMDTSRYRQIAPAIGVDEIDPLHLASLRAYNRFKITPPLYEHYRDYEFLLTYELDAFVFRDELLDWCAAGWDYIGAPWFEGGSHAVPGAAVRPGGNSGLSLRRISSARRVLRSFKRVRPFHEVYERWSRHGRWSPGGIRLLCQWGLSKNLFHPRFNGFEANEDEFWSLYADRGFPWFKVADYENARRFSFEMLPERLLEETGGRLPFGCHKWHEKTLPFWRPHIEAFGHHLPAATPALTGH